MLAQRTYLAYSFFLSHKCYNKYWFVTVSCQWEEHVSEIDLVCDVHELPPAWM